MLLWFYAVILLKKPVLYTLFNCAVITLLINARFSLGLFACQLQCCQVRKLIHRFYITPVIRSQRSYPQVIHRYVNASTHKYDFHIMSRSRGRFGYWLSCHGLQLEKTFCMAVCLVTPPPRMLSEATPVCRSHISYTTTNVLR